MAGRGYGRDEYRLALKYISESAAKYGVFTSIVMPNMYNDAKYEKKYMNMARIVADTFGGGWDHVRPPARRRVQRLAHLPQRVRRLHPLVAHHRRGKMIPDGDFIRLNTFSNDEERMSSISLQLMGRGPVSIADNPIDASVRNYDLPSLLKFAQNKEMLALNADGFVGQPLSDDLSSPNSQIWYGQMKNGDWVVGLFNREDTPSSAPSASRSSASSGR